MTTLDAIRTALVQSILGGVSCTLTHEDCVELLNALDHYEQVQDELMEAQKTLTAIEGDYGK